MPRESLVCIKKTAMPIRLTFSLEKVISRETRLWAKTAGTVGRCGQGRESRAQSENDVSFSHSGTQDAHATGKAVIMWATRAYVAARAPDDGPVRVVCQMLRLHACSVRCEMVANP